MWIKKSILKNEQDCRKGQAEIIKKQKEIIKNLEDKISIYEKIEANDKNYIKEVENFKPESEKGNLKMKMTNLKWDDERKGYVCENCGAFYERPKGWTLPVSWCAKCHKEFVMEKEN